MSISLKRPPNLRSPPRLFTVIPPYPSLLLISVISFTLHFSLNSTLSALYPNDEALAEMEDRVKGEIWRFLVGGARFVCFVGMIVACIGIWGAVKDHLSSLRIFSLHSFVSLFISTLFVSSFLFLSMLPEDHPISRSFTQLLCSELTEGDLFTHSSSSSSSTVPWFFDLDSDTLGWGMESCEERWRSTVGFGTLLLLIGLGMLSHGVWVVWGYYRLAMVRRNWSMSAEVGGARGGAYHKRARSRSKSASGSGSGSGSSSTNPVNRHRSLSRSSGMELSSSSDSNGNTMSKQPRILLLPPNTDMTSFSSSSSSGVFTEEPSNISFKITPASPERTSFPPLRSSSSSSSRTRSGSDSGKKEYVVYAPIRLSMQEAMALNAREAFVQSPLINSASSNRQSSNLSGSGESTPTPSVSGIGGRNRSDSAATVIPEREREVELPRYDEIEMDRKKRVY